MEDATKERKKTGHIPTYDYKKVLTVLLKTRDKRTSVVKDELVEIFPEYKDASLKWYSRALLKLESEGFVEKITKPRDIAYYWVITEAGIKVRNEEQEN